MPLYCHVTLMLMVLPSQALESMFTCMNKTEECPAAGEWDDKTGQYKCSGAWRYICMLGKGSVLLEGCMPNSDILVGTHGCPFVESCDKDIDLPFSPGGWPVLSGKGFIPCEKLERCPGQNHTVSVFDIKNFSECLTLKKRKISTVPFSVITYDATSTTRDNLNENNVGNGNTRTIILSVVLPLVIIAVAVAAGVFCYMYRRGKIAYARKDPEKQAYQKEVFPAERKKEDDSQVDPESKDLKECEAENEPLVSKNIKNSGSNEDLTIKQMVDESCKPSISTPRTDRRILVISSIGPINKKESTSAASSVDQITSQCDGSEDHQVIEIYTPFLVSPDGDTTEDESVLDQSMEKTLLVPKEGDTTEYQSVLDQSMEKTLLVPKEEFDSQSLGDEDDKEKEYTNAEVFTQWIHYCMRVTQSNTGSKLECEKQAESYCDTCRVKNLYCKNCGMKHSNNNKDHGVIPYINFGQRCKLVEHKGVPLSRWCSVCLKYLCFECLKIHRCEGQLQNLKVRLDTLNVLMTKKNESLKLKADFKRKELNHFQDREKTLLSKKDTLEEGDYNRLLFRNMRERNEVENQIMELEEKIESNKAAMRRQCLNELEKLVLVDIDTVGEWRETDATISHPLEKLS